jgi:hypothetical protein
MSAPVCEHCRLEIEGELHEFAGFDPARTRHTYHPGCWREYLKQSQAKQEEACRARADAADLKRRLRIFNQSFADCCVGARLVDNIDIEGWGFRGDDDDDEVVARRGPLRFPSWPWARFDNADFRQRVDPRLLAAVDAYKPSEHGSLVECAPTGRGKSALLVAWIWRWREELRARVLEGAGLTMSFAWVSGFELAGARKRSGLGDEAPLVKLACAVSLLVLDEVGQEPPGEESFVVLDARYREGKPTIITTPLAPKALMQHLGGGGYRRVLEHGALVEAFGDVPAAKASVRVVR